MAAADFLRLIRADPDNDAPRLVYADWLDDQGQGARAEFIRIQCAAAALPADDRRVATFRARADVLLEQFRVAWSEPLPGLAIRWDWSRGFPENVRLETKVFLARGDSIFAAVPVRHVELLDVANLATALASSPMLERLESITINGSPAGDALARALAGSPYVGQLATLQLCRSGLTDAAIIYLAASARFSRLTTLDLSENEIGSVGAHALAAATPLTGLSTLRLRGNPLGAEGAAAILNSTRLANLQELDLSRTECTFSALQRPPACCAIRVLNLSGNDLADVGVRLLSEWQPLEDLRELDLSRTGVGDDGAAALADSPYLAGLRRIVLNGNRITEVGKRRLLAAPHLHQVTSWELRENPR